MGYVRALIEYSLQVQVYGWQTSLASLDSIQNQAIRLICDTFRTTPIVAGEIMADISPLALRRERAIVLACERYRRLEKESPLRQMVDEWVGRNRIKRTSFMHEAVRLSVELEFSHLRDELALTGIFLPALAPALPEIRKSLIDSTVSKQSDENVKKVVARETVASYPADLIHIFTDGSTREVNGELRSRYGAVIRFPGSNENDELVGPCGG